MNLVIVESPTKAKTIQHFLPAGFTVKSSFGHIRDLPRGKLGVDVANNFEPKYVVSILARKRLAEIKKSLPKAKKVILATDEDREGEAIAWHLTQALGLPTTDYRLQPENIERTKLSSKKAVDGSRSTVVVERIAFHEITKKAVQEALNNPRQIDMDLVNAQQARRILDRLVGYELSPFLWKKVAKGLSAGRVQSVAVRLVVEREREIEKFKAEEYWSIEALLQSRGTTRNLEPTQSDAENTFTAQLTKQNGKIIPKLGLKTTNEAQKIVDDLTGAKWQVASLEQKEAQRHPAPPFTTSTLQQDAGNKLHFSAKQTMQIAQQLYEGISLGEAGSVGLITYMRTDSLNLSLTAIDDIRNYIVKNFGERYAPPDPRVYKTKSKGAQEAHEAIRPTNIGLEPESIKQYLTPQQHKLYNLIWQRALACQMSAAILAMTAVDVEAKSPISPPFEKGGLGGIYTFHATGSQIKFDGFLKIYSGKIQETILPPLAKDELLNLLKLTPDQHFTQPPARFSEATLIKALEQLGIGRPSTYAPTLSTIQERNYVQKNEEKRLAPTDIGLTVNDILVQHFPQIVDLKFTAKMEKELDEIAAGQKKWQPVLAKFYQPFKQNLTQKYDDVKEQKPEPEATDKICPQCGGPIIIRTSRFGKFYACSKFPACRYTENIANDTGLYCPKCVEGKIVIKRTKRGKTFYGCGRYPDCDFALWDKPTGQKCPECESPLVENKNGVKCSNKECKYKEPRPEIKD